MILQCGHAEPYLVRHGDLCLHIIIPLQWLPTLKKCDFRCFRPTSFFWGEQVSRQFDFFRKLVPFGSKFSESDLGAQDKALHG